MLIPDSNDPRDFGAVIVGKPSKNCWGWRAYFEGEKIGGGETTSGEVRAVKNPHEHPQLNSASSKRIVAPALAAQVLDAVRGGVKHGGDRGVAQNARCVTQAVDDVAASLAGASVAKTLHPLRASKCPPDRDRGRTDTIHDRVQFPCFDDDRSINVPQAHSVSEIGPSLLRRA